VESSRTEETKAELNQMPKHPVLPVSVMERKMERKMYRKVQEQGNTFMRHETLLQPRIQTNAAKLAKDRCSETPTRP